MVSTHDLLFGMLSAFGWVIGLGVIVCLLVLGALSLRGQISFWWYQRQTRRRGW